MLFIDDDVRLQPSHDQNRGIFRPIKLMSANGFSYEAQCLVARPSLAWTFEPFSDKHSPNFVEPHNTPNVDCMTQASPGRVDVRTGGAQSEPFRHARVPVAFRPGFRGCSDRTYLVPRISHCCVVDLEPRARANFRCDLVDNEATLRRPRCGCR